MNPHSKPKVYEFDGAFVADFSICCGESFNVWRLWHGTWAEAMDAAQAHVADVHMPRVEASLINRLDAITAAVEAGADVVRGDGWEIRLHRDSPPMDDPMNTTHNGSRSDT